MCPARVDAEFAVVAGCEPARVHEEAVVEKGIEGPDHEEARGHLSEISVERGDVGIREIFRSEVGYEPLHRVSVDRPRAVWRLSEAWRHCEVEDPSCHCCSGESRVSVPVTHPQEGHGG